MTGIDLAPEMLERAQERVNRNGWRHITLQQGDALNLAFADDAFDYVMAFHVVSVVPDPQRMMAEAQRVCRPGGLLTIINHFRSPQPAVARMQRGIDPLTRRLGWTTTLRLPGDPRRGPRCTSSGSGRRRAARCSRSWWRATRRRCRPAWRGGLARRAQ